MSYYVVVMLSGNILPDIRITFMCEKTNPKLYTDLMAGYPTLMLESCEVHTESEEPVTCTVNTSCIQVSVSVILLDDSYIFSTTGPA